MSFLIAVGGKGGVGKTTIAALLVKRLIARGRKPVLAVDADPNTCLDMALGVTARKTIGRIREESRSAAIEQTSMAGMSKQEQLELRISESMVEGDDFDFIAMGRCEGPGCYCYANNVLRSALAQIAGSYPYVVLDNEAGLENLSRRIVRKVDLMVLVSDGSRRGLETVVRIHDLAREMEIEYGRLVVIVNRCGDDRLAAVDGGLRKTTAARMVVALPPDNNIARFSEEGQSLLLLPGGNPVEARLDTVLDPCLIETTTMSMEKTDGKNS